MFIEAIEKADGFTRPIHSIQRYYRSTVVIPGATTLFFVNEEGWALTCKHVVDLVKVAGGIKVAYTAFKKELGDVGGQGRKALERKYGLSNKKTVEMLHMFVNCVEGRLQLEYRLHPSLDVALIKFNGFDKLLCDTFPVFPADTSGLKQGKFLCRLGYPFAEFTNFAYDEKSDSIAWTETGKQVTPRFPIEGMVTRHLGDEERIIGFELSRPGLRGQSGGPAFDVDGKVWGMQYRTNFLDLDFDVDTEVLRDGKKQRVRDNAFLNVGLCVHVDVLKDFMREHGVQFDEG